ncbi:DUF4082 domain-containing protein [Paenibacillus sp. LHD-117]|uniref:DUF4082 domain-containing protein n=1 Tax=Paenibacillus sp. LHD-117 TaxID=3071412 RepID=UPI0027E1F2A2|nr:DUF4082 domain-containing protein [Paenibacillus sp. LHD-117]MDQ6423638.1 DUF4082 domain-containing protein [Paenibacillus sp. LHD-117]
MKSVIKKLALVCTSVLLMQMLIWTAPVREAAAAEAVGTTYYVDSANGDDANSGTSEAIAWKTLEKVNGTIFAPGDQILFKSGGSWTGTLHPQGSGSAENVITIDKYGGEDKPIIDGGGAETAVSLHNQEYWTIQNLEIINDGEAEQKRNGVSLRSNGGKGIMHNITLRNLEIHHIKGNSDRANQFFNAAIYVYSDENLEGDSVTPVSYFDGLLIENNHIHDITVTGIYTDASHNSHEGDPETWHKNVVVRNNVIQNTGNDGIVIGFANSPLIEYNTVFEIANNAPKPEWCAGIWVFAAKDAVIQFNESAYAAYTGDSEGYDVDIYSPGTHYVQYNYSHDNTGGFMLTMPETNASKIIIRYNISQNDNRNNISNATISLGWPNEYVYNNVFYNDIPGQGITVRNTEKTYYNNNIFYTGVDYTYPSRAKFDNNLYFGHEATVFDEHKITEDPKFVNPGSGGDGRDTVGGYQLQAGSPAINAGKWIFNNGGKDYWGNPLYNGAPDIGAHEYHGEIFEPVEPPIEEPVEEEPTIPGQQTIFTYQIPAQFHNNGVYELGTRFRVNTEGKIYAIKAYTDIAEKGDHIARIWKSDGTLVWGPYTWNITGGTDEGWKTLWLDEPLELEVNTDYTVSVSNSSDDQIYPVTASFFNEPMQNGNLLTYKGSGVYSETLGTMPTKVYGNGSFFRDVLFVPNVLPEPENPEETGIADELENTSKMHEVMGTIQQQTLGAAEFFGDTSAFSGSDASIIYKSASQDIKSLEVTAYLFKWIEDNGWKPRDLTFETSVTGAADSYTTLETQRTLTENPVKTDFPRVVYTANELPAGTKYVKVILPRHNEGYEWATMLGRVNLEYELTAAGIEDELENTSKTHEVIGTIQQQALDAAEFFGDTSAFSGSDASIIYKSASQDIKSLEVTAYLFKWIEDNGWSPRDLTFATSVTGAVDSYTILETQRTLTENPVKTDFPRVVYIANQLPAGTKYVKVILPKHNAGYEWATMLGRVNLGFTEATGPTPTEPDPIVPKNIEIFKAASPIHIDGVLDMQWPQNPAIVLDGHHIAQGNPRLGISAEYKFAWDADHLYVFAHVNDITPRMNPNAGFNVWNGDAIEFFFGPSHLEQGGPILVNNDSQVILSAGDHDGVLQYYWYSYDTQVPVVMAVKKDEDEKGYSIEASIPLQDINILDPEAGTKFLFDFALDEGDGEYRASQFVWSSDKSVYQVRDNWGTAVLKDAPVITIGDYITTPTNQDITVTASTNEGTLNAVSHTFTENGSFDFVATYNGISTTVTVTIDNIDKTAPVIDIVSPTNGTYILNQNVVANWTASDTGSGVQTVSADKLNGEKINTNTAGTHTFTLTASDYAGNTTTKVVTYKVVYDFSGFLQPINSDVSSVFKQGSTVPVKFQLKDANGAYITNASAKIYIAKNTGNVIGSDFEAVSTSTNSTGNEFRLAGNKYIFNLSTKNLEVGTYRIKIEIITGNIVDTKEVTITLR